MRIAIIGGGAGAVSLVGSLLDRAEDLGPGVELSIYDPVSPGWGHAFGPDLDCVLMNVPNGSISIRGERRSHFLEWLEGDGLHKHPEGSGRLADAFSPRSVFGTYLADTLNAYRERAEQHGWRVSVHAQAVVGISERADGVLGVRSADSTRSCSHVVLAVGPGSPADPFGLNGTPGFFGDPYPLIDVLPKIEDSQAHVLVIGTGLTAVDTAIGLLYLGHQGAITLTSREGILPQVLAPSVDKPLTHITAANIEERLEARNEIRLDDVTELLRNELAVDGFDLRTEISWLREGVPQREYLRHQLTSSNGNPVQSVLKRIPVALEQRIRSSLAPEVARLVSAHTNRLKGMQSPMPRQTARTLLEAMDSGQLAVVPGLSAVLREPGTYAAAAAHRIPPAQVVIDATRTSPAKSKGRSRRLLASLVAHGFASWGSSDALRVEPESGRLITSSGVTHPRLFALGEITAGGTYFASSLPAVNRGAAAVASAIARTGPGAQGATR